MSTAYTELLPTKRPWLALYNVRLKPRASPMAVTVEEDMAPIQRMFPEELMLSLFGRMGPYALGRAAGVCRQWRRYAEHPRHWEVAAREALSPSGRDDAALREQATRQFAGSWRRMFLELPHVRFDGLYVARNTYVRMGVVELRNRQTVHLVCYYRYIRFWPDGTLLYRTSPLPVSKVARSLARHPSKVACAPRGDEVHSQCGRYALVGGTVFSSVAHANSSGTEVRCRLGLRSTRPGANDRMDIHKLLSWDRGTGTGTPLSAANAEEEPDGERKEYRRGLAPYVFVPFEQVQTHQLNLPPTQMDFYLAN